MSPKKRDRSPSPVLPWDHDSGDSDYGIDHQQILETGESLVEELISMYLMGKPMTAKSLCTLCWYAKNAGVKPAKKYSFRVGAPTGHYQRKLDSALGFKRFDGQLYEMTVPGYDRHGVEREPQTIHVIPPHESLSAELAEHPEILRDWREKVEGQRWIAEYEANPIIQNSSPDERAITLPIAMYMDKVPFTKKESFMGIFCNFIGTGKRHMLACLRTSDMCSCGCSHWCTLYPIYLMLSWSLRAMINQTHPVARHENVDWHHGSDDRRKRMAGQAGTADGACKGSSVYRISSSMS